MDVEDKKLAAIMTPSVRLWTASPIRSMNPVAPWTSQFTSWQCRKTNIFSRMKKRTIPANTLDKTTYVVVLFKACGIKPNSAAASKVPVAYETKDGTRVFLLFS